MSGAAPQAAPAPWPTVRARLLAGQYLRSVNFHNTPSRCAEGYRQEFRFLSEHFSPVDEDDLHRLMITGRWHKDRPGVIPSFFEGYRNNFDVAYPLLEEVGLVGWFFVPTGFLSVPVPEQRAYANAHHIDLLPEDAGSFERLAMTWDELGEVARGHVIASHTRSHTRLAPDGPDEALLEEVLGPQLDLEREVGRRARSFAWLYGGPYIPDSAAGRHIRKAGYEFLFGSFSIQHITPVGAG